MKLCIAQKYSDQIKQKAVELNRLVSAAALDNIYIELSVLEVTTLGQRYYPAVEVAITINPNDID